MAVCPVCAKDIDVQDKHHGTLYTCAHCRAVFFVGWDGQPEGAPAHEPEPEPLVMEPSPPPDFSASEEPMPEPAPAYEPPPADESPAETPIENSTETPAFEAPAEPVAFEASAESAEPAAGLEAVPEAPLEEAPVEAPPAEEPLADFGGPLDPFAASGAAAAPASGDFSDVAEYANSQESAAGPLSYTIRIRGLELAETFETLREALTDSRFGWDAEEVMSRVSAGELTLRGMNPTKASILINRIKYLPIEIDWNQEVFGGA